ncbi:MAG: metallophosphoesterase [Deltaproteobacteria bacterium]
MTKLLSIATAALAIVLVGCPGSGLNQIASCQSSLDCPQGQGCANGICEPLAPVQSSGGSSAGQTQTTGAQTTTGGSSTSSSGASAGSSSSSSAGTSAGSSSGTSAGAASSSTSAGTSAGGSSTGTGWTSGGSSSSSSGSGSSSGGSSGSCGCSAACCSEQASASSTKTSGYLTCPNGKICYGSWYCSLAAGGSCTQADPCNGQSGTMTACGGSGSSSSSSGSSSSGGSTSGGSSGGSTGLPTPTGTVGPNGGSVSSLNFAVIGDTRPGNVDDTANYPTQIITQIFQDLQASNPRPQFVIAGGDYMFATPGAGTAEPQAADYMAAAKSYTGQVFPALGNHECTGYTASNCGAGGSDGITENYTTFLNTILGGFGISASNYPSLANQEAYYSVNVKSSDSSNPWTAKFVMVAANDWDSTQSSWLAQVMQQTTTYTFVARHEPQEDGSKCTGCGASDQIINQYPYTMLLVGHTHEYRQSSTASGQVELIVGNGGAPMSSGTYGYELCAQQSNGNISCGQYAYNSPSAATSTVTVNAAGATQ